MHCSLELSSWRRVLRFSRTEYYKTNVWVRQKIGVPEENGLLEQLKKTEVGQTWALYEKWSLGLVMAVTAGKCLPGRLRTAWIDDVRRWTEGGLLAVANSAWQVMTDEDWKTKHCGEMSTTTVRQPTARGPDRARDVILSGPPSHLSKFKIYHVR